jgi:hypothetical protein
MLAAPTVRSLYFRSQFIGPDGAVNGGHLAGILERELAGPVEVSLRRPTPPDRWIELHAPDDATRELWFDDEVLVTARRRPVSIEAPSPVAFERAAAIGGDHAHLHGHPFPRCFVCGPERGVGAGLRIFPGELEPGRVAAPVVFLPPFAGERGLVRREHVTAALDCPGGWAIFSADRPEPMVLASFAVRHEAPVRVGERCVAVGLATGFDGRKRWASTALYGEDGALRASAHALWIVLASAATDRF